jgi:hypothetical protein
VTRPCLDEHEISRRRWQTLRPDPGLAGTFHEHEELIRFRMNLLADLPVRRQGHHHHLLVGAGMDDAPERVVDEGLGTDVDPCGLLRFDDARSHR